MGLLSDTKNRHKLAELLHNHNSILSTVCYIGGFVAFLLMAHMPFNNSTYFSENALLPGIVDGEFYGGADADSFTKEYISVLKQQKGAVPVDWIHNKLRQFGLDVYEHNYSYVYPLQLSENQVISAKNIYAILRAPKSASTESVVLSTVIRNSDGPLPSNAAGVGLILAMAKFFKKHTYWAKDIIFLMTDHEAIGTQAWLEAYHSTHSKYIHSEDINGRAGSIQAAINIEIESSHIGYFDIRSEGLNGQLPNLDLINLCVRLCEKERMTPKLHHRGDYWNMDSKEGFQHSLKTYLSMMWHQASGSVSGNHGLYHRYGIEAVTLAGVKSRRATSKQGFTPMGRVIEGIFRGLNNLLERFHQSFFFYLLPATHRYVSIGNYMPPFGVMALGLLLKALSLWLNDESKDEVDDQAGGDTNIKKDINSLEETSSGRHTFDYRSYPVIKCV
ncbi:GPI-anchor transamidase component GPAA1-like isoform X2 [Tubulanus polymorphus]|uniref:GPI-anchor transamidase component GPAA1-like isoform X2 n=1 Tax=Tubulanus polymorphus TaxID=672921 RepID=UPI003DA5BB7B